MSEIASSNDRELQVITSAQSKPRKPKRITVQLESGRSVAVAGVNGSLDGFIEMLEDALGKARKARQLKLSLKTFVSMLQDQAENAETD